MDTTPLSEGAAERLRRERVPEARATLIVYQREGTTLVSLDPGAAITVGREAPADLVIDDRSLSRRHARFSWIDGQIVVEDLGSTNGVFVAGRRIEGRVALGPDEVVALGGVTIALHRLRAGGSDSPSILGHDRFRQAVEHEVRRARHFGRPVVVVAARAPGERHAARWIPRVQAALASVDEVGFYSPDTLEILLPEATQERALEVVRRITDGDPIVMIGLASFPSAADGPEALLDVALGALRGASTAEPVCAAPDLGARELPASGAGADGPIASSPEMRALFSTIERVARSDIPVLVRGETGSGKEVVARAIHAGGPRGPRPLVCVNCGAIPAHLVESTLFGHERGAFTGAVQQHRGVFEAADGGTVLLDEVGELPAAAQAALLRVLETGRVVRVGSTREVSVDVRVIAATHRDLEAMATAGTFRTDLLYRLDGITLEVPPLRARGDEIRTLVTRFLWNATRGERSVEVDERAMAMLERYGWPGNVRELKNVVARAVVVADGDVVRVEDLPERVRAAASVVAHRPPAHAEVASVPPSAPAADAGPDMKSQLQVAEAAIIVEALRASGWNQSEAARRLNVPLRTLVHKIKQFGIKKLGYGLPR